MLAELIADDELASFGAADADGDSSDDPDGDLDDDGVPDVGDDDIVVDGACDEGGLAVSGRFAGGCDID